MPGGRCLEYFYGYQQLSGSQDAIVEGLTAQVDAVVFRKTGTLTVRRIVLLKLGRQHLNVELVGKFALGNNLHRERCHCHPLNSLTIGVKHFSLDALTKTQRACNRVPANGKLMR